MLIAAVVFAASSLIAGLQSDLSHYLATRAKIEHISAVSLSVYTPGEPKNINVAVGTMHYGSGARITPATLYQIGSNTKSFTSAAILELESEEKLSIDQTIGRWLPEYPAWGDVTIRRLLNMTSDIPTYDDEESMLAAYAAHPTRDWTPAELIGVVYPKTVPNAGWLYSNTGYVMLELIIERAGGRNYADALRERFFNNPQIGLTSTYYEPSLYPPEITNRMVSGYFYSTDPDNDGLQPLYGKDMRGLSLSWARGAGGIVSTPEDVTRWCRALYGGMFLKPQQLHELETLVSQKDGAAIATTTAQEPRGFGLGVGQMLMPKLGRVWFYEGMTLGYRMTYVYFPKTGVTFAVGLNSQPNKKDDEVGKLMMAVFDRLHAAGKA